MIPAPNLPMLAARVADERSGLAGFLTYREGQFRPVSYRTWFEEINRLAVRLRDLDVGPGTRVLLMMETRYEWLVADLAILSLGAWTVPVYPNLSVSQLAHVVEDAEPEVAIVSRPELLLRLTKGIGASERMRRIFLLEGEPKGESAIRIEPLREILDGPNPDEKRSAELASLREGIRPTDPATLLYTSGTSAMPKGVILSHEAILSNARMILTSLPMRESDRILSILPLTHILERTTAYTAISIGLTLAYGRGLESFVRDASLVRPTIVVGVPRLFEKIVDQLRVAARNRGRLAKNLFVFAERAACRRGRFGPAPLLDPDGSLRPFRGIDLLWEHLFYRPFRERLGGELRFFVSGSAPLGVREAEFFCGIGLPLLEGYGLTEAGPVVSVNRLDAWRAGTVGRALEGVEIRIGEDGEILVKSPSLMSGYLNLETETRVHLQGGWLHTGDRGHLDADRFLVIGGRKKEMIVTSGGKNIAPLPIEEQLRLSPIINEAVVFGDRRPHLVALLVADPEALAAQTGLSPEEVLAEPAALSLVRKEVDRVNQRLAPHERIRSFSLLEKPLSIEAGTLTPTLKVRRAALEALEADRISALYDRPRR